MELAYDGYIESEFVKETIIAATNQILDDLAEKDTLPGRIIAPDRYLPMPYDDFAALTSQTEAESVSQYNAAVASAIALVKFKQNSSHYPSFCPVAVQIKQEAISPEWLEAAEAGGMEHALRILDRVGV